MAAGPAIADPLASIDGYDRRRRRGQRRVDAAYRAKYGRFARIVDGITDAEARSSTLRLLPRA